MPGGFVRRRLRVWRHLGVEHQRAVECLTCPLYAMGNPLRFLFFSSQQKEAFTDVHVQFFRQIAGRFSHAIEKFRL
ncbi:hypothetical protein DRQ50_14195 [bacterium]|nr:MAG: hypothetical protein DRQ50_14195 [bacterium]